MQAFVLVLRHRPYQLKLLAKLLRVSAGEEWSQLEIKQTAAVCFLIWLRDNWHSLHSRWQGHTHTGLLPSLWGICSHDRDDPKEKCYHIAKCLTQCEKLDRCTFFSPWAIYALWTCSAKQFMPPGYSHGLIKSMESFCSLQRELHNRVKAAALRTEVLVSIMHIVIYNVFIFLLYSLQLLSALKGRSTLTWLKWFNTEDPIHFFE